MVMTFAEIRAAFDAKMTAIADKIRGYTNKTALLGLDDMPAAVDAAVDSVVSRLTAGTATEIQLGGCTKIRSYAFYYNKKLEKVTVTRNRLDGIFYAAFYMNTALEEISAKTVIRIGAVAFKGCSSLKVCDFSQATKVPNLDDVNAFSGVPDTCIIRVPIALYEEWIATTNWVDLADHIVKDLEFGRVDYDFTIDTESWMMGAVTGFGVSGPGYESLTDATVPATYDGQTVVAIGDQAFQGFETLKTITVAAPLKGIGREAFKNCIGLERVVLEKNVRKIRYEAFRGCTSCLLYDFSKCTSIPVLDNPNVFYGIHEDAKILVPSVLSEAWKAATNWSQYADHMIAV